MALVIVLGGCGPPYKISPAFWDRSGEIERVGFYPLVYMQDGKEQRLFGDAFERIFQSEAAMLPMKEPVTMDGRDAVIDAFEEANRTLVDSVFVDGMSGVKFPNYGYPSTEALEDISATYDAVVIPVLLQYNEADAGAQMTQMCLSSCLTGGMVTACEQNMLRMTLDLVDTETGSSLWTYKIEYGGELGEQRINYSQKAVKGFGKYFPFSRVFEG